MLSLSARKPCWKRMAKVLYGPYHWLEQESSILIYIYIYIYMCVYIYIYIYIYRYIYIYSRYYQCAPVCILISLQGKFCALYAHSKGRYLSRSMLSSIISTLMSCKIFVVSSARLFVSICMHVVGVEWAHALRYLGKAGYS